MKREIVDAAIAKITALIAEYNSKLEALTPQDPPHWAPNIQHAGEWTIRKAVSDMIDAHFEGKRYRGKALEARRLRLSAEIVALPEWQALNTQIADSLIGGGEKYHERFG